MRGYSRKKKEIDKLLPSGQEQLASLKIYSKTTDVNQCQGRLRSQIQTFLGFIHLDVQSENLSLFFVFLADFSLSLEAGPHLHTQHTSYIYVLLTLSTATVLAWLPSPLPWPTDQLTNWSSCFPPRPITVDSPHSCQRGLLNINPIMFLLNLNSTVSPLLLEKNQHPNSFLSPSSR